MPAVYAHHRFGWEVCTLLPPAEQAVLWDHAGLFTLGLQGPDILFHYHPLRANPVARLGHGTNGRGENSFARRRKSSGGTARSPGTWPISWAFSATSSWTPSATGMWRNKPAPGRWTM